MIRIGDLGKVVLMAAETVTRQSIELTVLVTKEAVRCQMGSCQWKASARMIESRRSPRINRMARQTIMRE
jgi:hypothetical protein